MAISVQAINSSYRFLTSYSSSGQTTTVRGLEAQISRYENLIAQLKAQDSEGNASLISSLEGKAAILSNRLEVVTARSVADNLQPTSQLEQTPAADVKVATENESPFGAAYQVDVNGAAYGTGNANTWGGHVWEA